MKQKCLRLRGLLTIVLVAFGIGGLPLSAQGQEQGQDGYVAGEILVQLKQANDLSAVAAAHGLDAMPLDQFGARPIYLLRIVDGSTPPAKATALLVDPRVANAEPNYVGYIPEGVGKSSWSSGEMGAYAGQWAAPIIRLTEAHNVTLGAGSTVAVLDTGVDRSHSALENTLHPGYGYDFVNGDADPSEEGGRADLAYGHGTHVAGIVALAAPHARILPIRMLEPDGSGNLWVVIEALAYAVNPDGDLNTSDDAADVINLSFGFERRSSLLAQLVTEVTCEEEDDDDTLCGATDGRGAVFVAAAGNNGSSTPQYPAAEGTTGLLAVAASTASDSLASFSNYGPWVDLAAPGENITSSVPENSYGSWSGTSMSAPFVAGTAALVRAQDAGLVARDVATRLVETATGINGSVPLRLDAAAAVGGSGNLECRGNIGASIVDNLTVPAGTTCTITGTTVRGNVQIEAGATLQISRAAVAGDIQAQGAAKVTIEDGSSVGGNIQLQKGGAVRLDYAQVQGDVQLQENYGALYVARSSIRGNMQLQGNTGGTTVMSNTVRGTLQCQDNLPRPTGRDNRASKLEGQCAAL